MTHADQLALEEEMLYAGRDRFYKTIKNLEEKGRSSETPYATQLMRHVIPSAVEYMDTLHKQPFKQRANVTDKMTVVDSSTMVYISMRVMFDMIPADATVTQVAYAIGYRIEDEAHSRAFKKYQKNFFKKVIQGMEDKFVKSYKHRHNVLLGGSSACRGFEWIRWTNAEIIAVGHRLMESIRSVSDIFKTEMIQTTSDIKSRQRRLRLTESAHEWMDDFMLTNELARPDRTPTIVPPADWKSLTDGGYYHGLVRKRTPLIKFKGYKHQSMLEDTMDAGKLMQAVNYLQRVPYQVNQAVLDVMTEVMKKSLGAGLPTMDKIEIPGFPFHEDWDKNFAPDDELKVFSLWKREAALARTKNITRANKCLTAARTINLARRFSEYDRFYFVYQADFRGRLYCASSTLWPQGPDTVKGLLTFADKKELGESGGYWLCVHGANVYGEDKVSYDDRVSFIHDKRDDILAVASDPIEYRSLWADADKPWQYLAFCFDYARWADTGFSNDYCSNLAVHVDGSCSGIQHYSAMLRDEVGGASVNLLDSDKPKDIYGDVSKIVLSEIGDSDLAKQWLEFGVNRKTTKRCVMTLPYGATKAGALSFIEEYMDTDEDLASHLWPDAYKRYEAAAFLRDLVWDAMTLGVQAAITAMTWLRDVSSWFSKRNTPLVYTNPLGMFLEQKVLAGKSTQIRVILDGSSIKVAVSNPTDQIDTRKQTNSIAPNFVHSLDSAHLGLTAIGCEANGIECFWPVHDSFGTHACNVQDLQRIIREEFVDMYSENDVLMDFAVQNNIDLQQFPLPEKGNLNIYDVLDSKYLFG